MKNLFKLISKGNQRAMSSTLKLISISCLLLCVALFSYCSSESETYSNNKDLNIISRAGSIDTTYVSASGFTYSSPSANTTVITATGNSEWLDNNGGTVWTSYSGPGYSYTVTCSCVSGGGTCRIGTNLNHKSWCVVHENCDNCEMTVIIKDAQNQVITQLSNGITIRSY